MIEIIVGSTEELIIRYLQRHYPVTFAELHKHLHLSHATIKRTLLKLQHHGVLRVDPLPGNAYIRLVRSDFYFLGDRKPTKTTPRRPKPPPPPDYDGIMYS